MVCRQILNSLWADLKPIITITYNNSSNALKAVPTQQQQHHNITHNNSSNILIAVLYRQYTHSSTHTGVGMLAVILIIYSCKNTYKIFKLACGNDGKVQVTVNRYLAT